MGWLATVAPHPRYSVVDSTLASTFSVYYISDIKE